MGICGESGRGNERASVASARGRALVRTRMREINWKSPFAQGFWRRGGGNSTTVLLYRGLSLENIILCVPFLAHQRAQIHLTV